MSLRGARWWVAGRGRREGNGWSCLGEGKHVSSLLISPSLQPRPYLPLLPFLPSLSPSLPSSLHHPRNTRATGQFPSSPAHTDIPLLPRQVKQQNSPAEVTPRNCDVERKRKEGRKEGRRKRVFSSLPFGHYLISMVKCILPAIHTRDDITKKAS